MHELTRKEARRVAVRAQQLTAERPPDLVETVARLGFVQIDPIAAVAPSADLVLWSRLGSAYAPDDLREALSLRTLVELRGVVRPAEDLVLFRAAMAVWPGPGPLKTWEQQIVGWVEANDACRRDLLARFGSAGPQSIAELPDTCAVPWRSSGWNDDKNLARLLDLMAARGEVAVAGRRGRDKLWDLADRVYPEEDPLPLADAARERARRRLEALGIARPRLAAADVDSLDLSGVGEPARIEGVRGTWRVDPARLDRATEPFDRRTALLAPLDQLIHDRKRMLELFEFDYQLEMYKPAAARRWGYWAMPVLQGERLVGKVDATADRRNGVLRVDALHADDGLSVGPVEDEIGRLAEWLELRVS